MEVLSIFWIKPRQVKVSNDGMPFLVIGKHVVNVLSGVVGLSRAGSASVKVNQSYPPKKEVAAPSSLEKKPPPAMNLTIRRKTMKAVRATA